MALNTFEPSAAFVESIGSGFLISPAGGWLPPAATWSG
jgi:hypothetical protein